MLSFLKKAKANILLLFLVLFFPISILNFVFAILNSWNSYGCEFLANFPFWFLLKSYNPSLYQSVLTNPTGRGPWFPDTWFYGPVHHLWVFPLTFFIHSANLFFHSMLIIYTFLILCVVFLLYKAIRKDKDYLFLVAYLTVVLGFSQLLSNLRQRNIELLEFCLIIVAYLCLRKNRDYAAGSLLCFASMSKLLPFIFLPYLLVKKRFKAVMGFLNTFIIIAYIAQITLGWQHWLFFNPHRMKVFGFPLVEDIITGREYFHQVSQNTSGLPSFVLMFFAKINMVKPVPVVTYKVENFLVPNLIYIASAFFIFILSFYLLYKTGKKANLFYEFSIVSLVMLLVSTHANPHYYIFTIFAFISILRMYSYDLKNYHLTKGPKILIFSAFVLFLLFIGNLVPFPISNKILFLKDMAFNYFATYNFFVIISLILWCFMLWIYYIDYKTAT